MRNRALRPHRGLAGGPARVGCPAACGGEPQPPDRGYPFVTGVKTGHTLRAGYVLVGAAGTAQDRPGGERGARRAERGRPRRGHARAAALGAQPLPARAGRSGRRGRWRDAGDRAPRRACRARAARGGGADGQEGPARAPPGGGAGRARRAAGRGHAGGQRERAGGRAGGPPRGARHRVGCTRSGYSAGRTLGPWGPLDVASPARHPARGRLAALRIRVRLRLVR